MGHWQAKRVVVSISSAIPWAALAITFADAGAIINKSVCLASDTCSTLYWKFLSKVSIRHLFPVNVSKVMGVIKLAAFAVMITVTSALCFFSILASEAAL